MFTNRTEMMPAVDGKISIVLARIIDTIFSRVKHFCFTLTFDRDDGFATLV